MTSVSDDNDERSHASRVKTYHVLATKKSTLDDGDPDRVQTCLYFEHAHGRWGVVNSTDLNDFGRNYVRLVQTFEIPPGIPPMVGIGPDPSVTLFGCVAKTLNSGDVDGPVAEFFLASVLKSYGHSSVMLPVATNSTRGLILIFMENDANRVGRLRATLDPEIKGSTGEGT